ncbi:MAG TPA: BTAD domain-containing putative transcriptional regulator [Anaerolineales bacterium]|nr:BTAD domain-containing putative transcriptional regulator [Anaerolineales bacterium]
MKQRMLSQNKNSLLAHAISKLNPEVFSHPVWVRFGKKGVSRSTHLIGDLLSAAKGLQEEDPGGACQILLLCAVYENCAGQHYHALRTTQQAISLAEHCNLTKEMIWAIWGACAISIQQGNYQQAASHFVDLQAEFGQQKEWMLANFIDVLRQSFPQPAMPNPMEHAQSPRDPSFADLLTFTFDWLQHWGFSSQTFELEIEVASSDPVSHRATHAETIQSFSPIQRWQGRWRSLALAFRGELKVQWAEKDSQPSKRRPSFWRSIIDSLHGYISNRNIDIHVPEDIPQIVDVPLLPPPQESHPKPRKKKSGSATQKVNRNHRSEQSSSAIPVAVHMLGAFSMTVGDLAVKLPSSRGLSLLKYLLLHHKQGTSREVLMDTFWPDAEPEMARNNLNVAMHSLRRALRKIVFLPVIIFEDGSYGLDPNLQVWLDVEEFERCVKAGQRLEARNQLTAAVTEYETAISLYQGDFLEQNPYEEWTVIDREHLRIAYLDTLDRLSHIYFGQERYAACITICQLILARDSCREDAHCLLMRCYSRQGQYHLALRQYQICVEVLQRELDIDPAWETTEFYEKIRRHEQI